MAGIEVGAHPLVVAVALGLLGPAVLAEEDQDRAPVERMASPGAEEIARVERLWRRARLLGEGEDEPQNQPWSHQRSSR